MDYSQLDDRTLREEMHRLLVRIESDGRKNMESLRSVKGGVESIKGGVESIQNRHDAFLTEYRKNKKAGRDRRDAKRAAEDEARDHL